MKKITDYLEKREEDLVFIQGKIPRSLFTPLKAELDRLGLSWNKFFIAAGKRFVEEVAQDRAVTRVMKSRKQV